MELFAFAFTPSDNSPVTGLTYQDVVGIRSAAWRAAWRDILPSLTFRDVCGAPGKLWFACKHRCSIFEANGAVWCGILVPGQTGREQIDYLAIRQRGRWVIGRVVTAPSHQPGANEIGAADAGLRLAAFQAQWPGAADLFRSAEAVEPCVGFDQGALWMFAPLRTWRPLRAAESEILTQRAQRTRRIEPGLGSRFFEFRS